jgi:uncharacterized Zn finger protein
LVAVLLYEGRPEEAWTAAVRHGVDEQTWMKLAHARESEHPLDSIPIYERAVKARIDTKNANGYRDAVRILKRVERAAASGGQPAMFQDVLSHVVEHHRRKPSLMDMLRKAGWL